MGFENTHEVLTVLCGLQS